MVAEEYIMRRTLESYGFEKASPEAILPYDPVAAKLIYKFGEVYHTHVMVNPPVCSSFYYPKKIVIEFKSCKEPLGISFARSILFAEKERAGILPICPELSAAAGKMHVHLQKNQPQYTVAFATFHKFGSSLLSFAYANQMPLLSFYEDSMYAGMKDCITKFKREFAKNAETRDLIHDFLSFKLPVTKCSELLCLRGMRWEQKLFEEFIKKTEFFISNTSLRLLENGKVLFLIWL